MSVGLTFKPELTFVKKPFFPKFCFKKLRTYIMVVKHIPYPILSKMLCHHINVIGRIAPMNDVKTDFFINLFCKTNFMVERTAIFLYITNKTAALCLKVMAVNVYACKHLFFLFIALSFGTDNGNSITILLQCSSFLTYTCIKGHRKVFHNNQYFPACTAFLFFHLYFAPLPTLSQRYSARYFVTFSAPLSLKCSAFRKSVSQFISSSCIFS